MESLVSLVKKNPKNVEFVEKYRGYRYLREKLVNQTFVAFIFYTIHIISTKAQKFEEISKMPRPNQNYSAVNANTLVTIAIIIFFQTKNNVTIHMADVVMMFTKACLSTSLRNLPLDNIYSCSIV